MGVENNTSLNPYKSVLKPARTGEVDRERADKLADDKASDRKNTTEGKITEQAQAAVKSALSVRNSANGLSPGISNLVSAAIGSASSEVKNEITKASNLKAPPQKLTLSPQLASLHGAVNNILIALERVGRTLPEGLVGQIVLGDKKVQDKLSPKDKDTVARAASASPAAIRAGQLEATIAGINEMLNKKYSGKISENKIAVAKALIQAALGGGMT